MAMAEAPGSITPSAHNCPAPRTSLGSPGTCTRREQHKTLSPHLRTCQWVSPKPAQSVVNSCPFLHTNTSSSSVNEVHYHSFDFLYINICRSSLSFSSELQLSLQMPSQPAFSSLENAVDLKSKTQQDVTRGEALLAQDAPGSAPSQLLRALPGWERKVLLDNSSHAPGNLFFILPWSTTSTIPPADWAPWNPLVKPGPAMKHPCL